MPGRLDPVDQAHVVQTRPVIADHVIEIDDPWKLARSFNSAAIARNDLAPPALMSLITAARSAARAVALLERACRAFAQSAAVVPLPQCLNALSCRFRRAPGRLLRCTVAYRESTLLAGRKEPASRPDVVQSADPTARHRDVHSAKFLRAVDENAWMNAFGGALRRAAQRCRGR